MEMETGYQDPVLRLPGLDEVEQRSWEEFLQTSLRLMGAVNAGLMETHQVRLSELLLLDVLAASDRGAARLSTVAEALMLPVGRVTKQVNSLEMRGLVSRNPSRYDRRGVLATITPEGRDRLESAMKTYGQQVRAHCVDPMSRREMIALSEGCRQIGAALKAAGHLGGHLSGRQSGHQGGHAVNS